MILYHNQPTKFKDYYNNLKDLVPDRTRSLNYTYDYKTSYLGFSISSYSVFLSYFVT